MELNLSAFLLFLLGIGIQIGVLILVFIFMRYLHRIKNDPEITLESLKEKRNTTNAISASYYHFWYRLLSSLLQIISPRELSIIVVFSRYAISVIAGLIIFIIFTILIEMLELSVPDAFMVFLMFVVSLAVAFLFIFIGISIFIFAPRHIQEKIDITKETPKSANRFGRILYYFQAARYGKRAVKVVAWYYRLGAMLFTGFAIFVLVIISFAIYDYFSN